MRGQAGGRKRAKQSRQEALARYAADPRYCEHCNALIEVKEHQRVPEVRRKRFCNRRCAAIFNNTKSPKRSASVFRPCERCGVPIPKRRRWGYSKVRFCDRCRGLSYCPDNRAGDQPRSAVARNAIQRHARRVYALSGKPYVCAVAACEYDKHVEIAHIKGVAGFPMDVLVRDVNTIDNLVALCPNHHWEFDRGLIALSEGCGMEQR